MAIGNFPENPKIILRKSPDEPKGSKNRCEEPVAEGVATRTVKQNRWFMLRGQDHAYSNWRVDAVADIWNYPVEKYRK